MAFADGRMIEIGGRVGRHPDAPHDGGGTMIGRDGEGDDLGESEGFKAMGEPCFRRFRGIALSPEFRRQPPADFDGVCREKWQIDRMAEPGETGAAAACGDLHRGEAVAVEPYAFAQLVELGVRLGAVAAEGKKFHDAGIGIDVVEKIAIPIFPIAQDKAFGADRDHLSNSVWR